MNFEETIAELVRQSVKDAVREELADLSDRPLLLTAVQAAELLNVSRRQVDKWITAGLLPKQPHITKTLIPRIALEEFAAGRDVVGDERAAS